ncbi:hypothetical protein SVIO_067990 [Streptomyces violaceusniger]|uniref:Xaa-Pro dipeptidyl-peptidase-like domain-containing protein n=1 Tax=Streptomyces violaceusniger TaxID=68280 RepID=A0A4D4LAE9_STRVO|nr:hypothetical protein SVIO_067990 [Streptomyces violaceusniger]
MRYRETFDRNLLVEDVWIPTRDGTTRLHARIWRPADAETAPVPALLEYLPYRKSDWTAPRDAQRHPWYAGHGYASVRVDLRGSGDSEGVMLDEYTATELADGVDVVNWLAHQPWCTGKVGMFGISWGGFNSLQIAALRPAPLKAIVTVCSTDDRYDNDVHYTGGAVLGIDMLAWAGTMLAFTARPRTPPPSARTAGCRCGGSGSTRSSRICTPGSPTRSGTTTGGTAASARTTARSRPPCSRSAAGPIRTGTPCRACWNTSTRPYAG